MLLGSDPWTCMRRMYLLHVCKLTSVEGQQTTAKKCPTCNPRGSYGDLQQCICTIGPRTTDLTNSDAGNTSEGYKLNMTFGLHQYIYEKKISHYIHGKCPPPIYSTFTRSRSLILSSPPNSPTISLHPISPAQQIPKANIKFAMAPISDIELPYWRGTSGVQVSIATVE
jgi:hypothetical protein